MTSWTSLPTEEAFITLRALGRVALTQAWCRASSSLWSGFSGMLIMQFLVQVQSNSFPQRNNQVTACGTVFSTLAPSHYHPLTVSMPMNVYRLVRVSLRHQKMFVGLVHGYSITRHWWIVHYSPISTMFTGGHRLRNTSQIMEKNQSIIPLWWGASLKSP